MRNSLVSRRDEEMLAPVWCDEDLKRIQFRADLHPLVVFRIHLVQALNIPKPRGHVLAKVARIWRAMFIEIFKVWAEEVCGVISLCQAALERIVLEKVDV